MTTKLFNEEYKFYMSLKIDYIRKVAFIYFATTFTDETKEEMAAFCANKEVEMYLK